MPLNPLRRIFLILLAAYVAWGLLYIFRTSFSIDGSRVFVLWDDAMISMRYARNIASGHGALWNPGGEHVQGYSNFGVTLLMAVIHLFPLSPTRTSLAFQLFNLGLIVYCAILVREITSRLFDSEVPGTFAAVVVMACAPLAILSLQGTDVGIITTLLLISLRMVVTETAGHGTWPARVYIVLAIGVLMRLDFALVYLMFAAASVFFPRTKGTLTVAIAVFAVGVGGILGFQQWYYGDALPNTYYLKATGSPVGLVFKTGLSQQIVFLQRAVIPLVFATLALIMFQPRDRRLWLLGGVPVALLAYDVRFGGDWVADYTSRFFAPALPLLVVVTVGGAWRLVQRIGLVSATAAESAPGVRPRRDMSLAAFALFSAVSVPTFNTTTAFREWVYPFRETMYRTSNIANYRRAHYLNEHASRDATIAVHWAGLIPYFVDRQAIDVLGKNDRHIARLVVPVFAPGHSKWDWRYVVGERRPDFVDLVTRGLDTREDFVSSYAKMTVEGLDLYVRKDSASKLHDPGAKLVPLK